MLIYCNIIRSSSLVLMENFESPKTLELFSSNDFESNNFGIGGTLGSPIIVSSGAFEGSYCMQAALDSPPNAVWFYIPESSSVTVNMHVLVSSVPGVYHGCSLIYLWGASGSVVGAIGIVDAGNGAQWQVYGDGGNVGSVLPGIYYLVSIQYDSVSQSTVFCVNGVVLSNSFNGFNEPIRAVSVGATGAVYMVSWNSGGVGLFDVITITTDTPVSGASATPTPTLAPSSSVSPSSSFLPTLAPSSSVSPVPSATVTPYSSVIPGASPTTFSPPPANGSPIVNNARNLQVIFGAIAIIGVLVGLTYYLKVKRKI